MIDPLFVVTDGIMPRELFILYDRKRKRRMQAASRELLTRYFMKRFGQFQLNLIAFGLLECNLTRDEARLLKDMLDGLIDAKRVLQKKH